jgi:pSer/pThr/pTyr-binding forkhead associated (FHA) protein
MGAPTVRLLLKGDLVREVAFEGPTLRIGRMKENEVVINNLSVSRFHATLTREGDVVTLKDLGSENGCWVNGRRVTECRVGAGDRIQIGKHQLEIVLGEPPAAAAAAPRGKSDAWDAAQTYLVGDETRAKMVAAAPAPTEAEAQADLSPLDTDGELAPPEEPPAYTPTEDGVALFGDAPPGGLAAGADLAEFDVSEMDLRDEDLRRPEPERAPAAAAPPAAARDTGEATGPTAALDGPGAALHAGLILQRHGRLERVFQWESDRLTLGRAAECEIVLATPEISRRHALLVREGGRFEVRDLESINGTFVNGEKVSRRALQVGDVVRIEDFELTFVLDRAPLGDAVRADATPAAPPAGADPGLTQIGEMLDLAPFVSEGEGDGESAEAISFEALAHVEPEPEVAMQGELEAPTVLLSEEEPYEEKDLVEAPQEARVLRLELRVRLDELPPALRDALAHLDPADLRLPVELRLATEL